MRRRFSTLLGFSFLFVATAAGAAVRHYAANLSGDPAGSTGAGQFTFDDQTHVLTGTVTHNVPSADTSFITNQPPDASTFGPLVQTYAGPSPINVTPTTLDASTQAALDRGDLRFYVQSPSVTIGGPIVFTGATTGGDAGTDASLDGAGGNDDAGGSDAADDAPTFHTDAGPVADDAGEAATTPGSTATGGCSCSTVASDGAAPFGALFAAAIGALALAARRRRPSRS